MEDLAVFVEGVRELEPVVIVTAGCKRSQNRPKT